jgi:hypothetical protein
LGNGDVVDEALVYAIRKATDAGEWERVTRFARVLQARRPAGPNVIVLDEARRDGRKKT